MCASCKRPRAWAAFMFYCGRTRHSKDSKAAGRNFPKRNAGICWNRFATWIASGVLAEPVDPDCLPQGLDPRPDVWAVYPADHSPAKESYCRVHQIEYHLLRRGDLAGFPEDDATAGQAASTSSRKRVMVTGCYDWFHSGHVRFFEEVSALGDLYVVVGHDGNIRLLKGEGHPLLPHDQRRYMAASVRFVKQALISSGHGWLDAEPEIELIRPHIYVVNEDGDRPEKRAYCEAHGIEYRVLKRLPKEGLPPRQGADLRRSHQ